MSDLSTLASDTTGGAALGGLPGAAIGAGLGIATDIFQDTEAQKNRDFQNDESSTAYQRARADMIAAGLNPALMYGQNGASTPGGSMATLQTPQIDMPSIMSQYQTETQRDTANKQRDMQQEQFAQNLQLNYQKMGIDKTVAAADIAKKMSEGKNIDADTQNEIQDHQINKIDEMKSDAWTSTRQFLYGEGTNNGKSYTVPPPQNPSIDPNVRAKRARDAILNDYWSGPGSNPGGI